MKRGVIATTCGTLVVDDAARLLLCHVTGTHAWDIPKGVLDPGESPLAAAVRELREETGLVHPPERFVDLGLFDYRPDKRLHLFRLDVGATLASLDALVCTSFFPHHRTGKATPEADAFRWATRDEVAQLCWPRMAARLLAIGW
jgi:8-oxo-dGTP pyrophosphatase MutT (NUDIX family)